MKLISENGYFSFAVDKNGKYWKKYKHFPWTAFSNGIALPKYKMPKIIATKNFNYWTKEANGTIIKRSCKYENRTYKRKKELDDLVLARKRKKQERKKKSH